MSVDRRRKGSLQFYNNSSRSLRSIIPVYTKAPQIYAVKVGMGQEVIDDVMTTVTYLQIVQQEKINEKQWKINFSEINSIRVRRKDVIRQIKTESLDHKTLEEQILNSKKLDVIGLTKGKGTQGPVKRRKIKMQKRKAAGSGCARKPGAMGLRSVARVVYTKPFSGKMGFSRRTITGLKNLGVENQTKLVPFFNNLNAKILKLGGSVMGPIGRIICIKKSCRK